MLCSISKTQNTDVLLSIKNDKKWPEQYLQPLNVGRNRIYDKLIDDKILCARNCTKYPYPRICYFKFVAEQYHAMGPACKNCPLSRDDCFSPQCVIADGIERTVLTFNRLLDGPAINVCYGDRVIVDVQNKMPARELSIHWHGVLQKRFPWMDGVPYVTQCPIPHNSRFRYDFFATTFGTHFYHSHSGLQLFDGLSGALIVRTSDIENPLRGLYDYDLFSHTILIQDWLHVMMDDKFPGYNRNKTMITIKPDTYLINGMGAYLNPVTLQWTGTPFAEFRVKPNKRYRFRIVSVASTTCSHQFTVEGHALELIATDGYLINPQKVRTLYMAGGETYDVVITADQTPRPYWIRVQGVEGNCATAFQQAVLRYKGTPEDSMPPTQNTEALFNSISELPELNNMRRTCRKNDDNLCLDEISSLYRAPDRLFGAPYKRFTFTIDAHLFIPEELYLSDSYHEYYLPESGPDVTPLGGMFVDTLNNMTNILPPFVLLGDPKNSLIDKIKCPEKCDSWCECLYLIKLRRDEVYEMIFIDELSVDLLRMDHPFHTHGHHFAVMKLGTKEDLNKPGAFEIDLNNRYPVVKDTLLIPASGFAVIRFIADNPGFWVLHCHFQIHNMVGMVIVLQVGEFDEMLPIPANWPKCGNYLPPEVNEEHGWASQFMNYFTAWTNKLASFVPGSIISWLEYFQKLIY
ncbi:uncharacterized protein LOC135848697 [Planococcus citri]|uniref:uncharacterized protein LOC135848697 n=1 Tax=Planococcus citri TaxID=170843 RepID=UPI0031F8C0F1